MMATPDRLARPVLPANPSQADLGAQAYYLVCMTCHGDRGQGLTQEWIDAWHLDEKDGCWQSKCHAANHPPEGFVLPKTIPAVTGPLIKARFATGLDLHNYIREKMPWQAPGTLTEEQYWQLTAYVLRLNGLDPGNTPLNETTATQIRLRPEPTPTPTPTPPAVEFISQNWYWLGVVAMMLIAGVFFLVKYISGKPG